MKFLLALGFLFISTVAIAKQAIVNVYNWAEFMPQSVLHQFEKETGIHVNYMEFDSNEALYAKLKANPHLGFDVIVPSSYYVQRMVRENMLEKLDKTKIPNISYLDPMLLNKNYDPGNQYTLPYLWGTTGIVVNDLYHRPTQFISWKDLWRQDLKNQLMILDDTREIFAIALITLGYSVNETNPNHIKEAYEKLRALLPNIKIFNTDAEITVYADEDATLGTGYNGDLYQAILENSHIHYLYPKEAFSLWIDCIAIPQYAPHLENAYRFINFINRPDIAAKISLHVGFSTPNLAAIKKFPKAMQQDEIFNPPKKTLARSVMIDDVGKADRIYERYWQLLKLGS